MAGWSARRRLLALLAAPILGLVAADLVVRVCGFEPPPLEVTEGALFRAVDDPIQIYENRPGAKMLVTYRESSAAEPRIVAMSVNALGFRGRTVSREKPAGVLRIACLGDSHTFGYGVADAETWPAQLERVLRQRRPDRPIEVLNCGVNAYDTMQEVLWLKRTVLAFQPDVVVMQYYVNDTAARNLGVTDGGADWLVMLTHPAQTGRIATLRAWSPLLHLLCDGVYRRRSLAVYAQDRLKLYAPDSPGWLRVQHALIDARDELGPRGVAFRLALFPFLFRDGDHLSSHRQFEIVKEFCAREGVPCIDTEPAFVGADLDRLRVSVRDYHANADGYAIFARAVADGLERDGLVPAAH